MFYPPPQTKQNETTKKHSIFRVGKTTPDHLHFVPESESVPFHSEAILLKGRKGSHCLVLYFSNSLWLLIVKNNLIFLPSKSLAFSQLEQQVFLFPLKIRDHYAHLTASPPGLTDRLSTCHYNLELEGGVSSDPLWWYCLLLF